MHDHHSGRGTDRHAASRGNAPRDLIHAGAVDRGNDNVAIGDDIRRSGGERPVGIVADERARPDVHHVDAARSGHTDRAASSDGCRYRDEVFFRFCLDFHIVLDIDRRAADVGKRVLVDYADVGAGSDPAASARCHHARDGEDGGGIKSVQADILRQRAARIHFVDLRAVRDIGVGVLVEHLHGR